MASWIVHLRLCDRLLDRFDISDPSLFAAGNILPDCGSELAFGVYDPPTQVSHFTPTGRKRDIQYERFFNEYCVPARPEELPMYLGYYVHLATDWLWVRDIYYPDQKRFSENFARDERFALEFKKDWYDCDRLYLREHPDFRAYRLLLSYSGGRRYFDFYSPDAVKNKIEYIEKFYLPDGRELDREYPYVPPARVDAFVDSAAKELEGIIITKMG